MNRRLVVIPTYNERNNLPRLAERILRLSPPFDILVVDDNSPDGTGDVADELARGFPAVRVLHRPRKEGLGRAYVAGFKWALAEGYEFVFEMDADHSHHPDELIELLAASERYDLALGSRYVGGILVLDWDMRRLLISSFGNWYARAVTGLPYSDLTGGFKCYRRAVLEAIDLDGVHSVGYAFQIEMTWWAVQRGFRVGEVPITFYGRDHGETKFSKAIVWEAVWTVWKLRLGLIRNHAPQAAPRLDALGAAPPAE
ncbi:MAG: dolichyl-phosphate beta-D-mannosyltransferase [Acidobacteria bacterium RBG_16_68_9]|nr:MAG: dolichyl-phosphate beta-D-mannosyltransferase [Acidobacteria bacterium RBG_16_68_9]